MLKIIKLFMLLNLLKIRERVNAEMRVCSVESVLWQPHTPISKQREIEYRVYKDVVSILNAEIDFIRKDFK